MPPAAFILITFGVWALVKGRAQAYWALATTPNASKGAGSVPSTTGASAGTLVTPKAPSAPAAPAMPTTVAPAAPNVIGG